MVSLRPAPGALGPPLGISILPFSLCAIFLVKVHFVLHV